MSDRDTAALIALLRQDDHPWGHIAEAVEDAGSAVRVLEGGVDAARQGDGLQLFEAPSREVDLAPIVEEIKAWRTEGFSVLSILDEDYPRNLRMIHNRPPIIFVRGGLTEDDSNSVAVVGARKASPEGLAAAKAMAEGIAEGGYTVVSGLAAGVDSAAHTTALHRGARTVAVIGTGIRRFYPPANEELQKTIAERGAVLSQFWPDAPPSKKSFPMRNAVMSGFALATVVIEATNTSGARMQARLALEHNRPVFLHRRLLVHQWARECAERPGAHVIDGADQVLGRIERLTDVGELALSI